MKPKWQAVVVLCVLIVLIAVPLLSCGGKGGEEVVTITIGNVTDLTGPASVSMRYINYALEDLAKYYNEEHLIPGVKVKIISYDTQYDPSRALPGYDWARAHGAKITVSVMSFIGEQIKPFAARDKVPLVNLETTKALIDPPGWVFCTSSLGVDSARTMLKWISENHWDWEQKGPAKIGFCGWNFSTSTEIVDAWKGYCQSHPNQFDWSGSYLVPIGATMLAGEVEKLKNCDYVGAVGNPTAYLARDFHGIGSHVTLLDPSTAALAGVQFYSDIAGWDALDGMLSISGSPLWDQDMPVVNLARELLDRYRGDKAQEIISTGSPYVGSLHNQLPILEILQAAVQKVGAENFDGQAFYDAAIKYQTSGPTWEGYPTWGFSETKRDLIDDRLMYRWDAEVENVVKVSDWIPAVKE